MDEWKGFLAYVEQGVGCVVGAAIRDGRTPSLELHLRTLNEYVTILYPAALTHPLVLEAS